MHAHAKQVTQRTSKGKLQHRILCEWLESTYPNEIIPDVRWDNRVEAAKASEQEAKVGLRQAGKKLEDVTARNEELRAAGDELKTELDKVKEEYERDMIAIKRAKDEQVDLVNRQFEAKIADQKAIIEKIKAEMENSEQVEVARLRRELERVQADKKRTEMEKEQVDVDIQNLSDKLKNSGAAFEKFQVEQRMEFDKKLARITMAHAGSYEDCNQDIDETLMMFQSMHHGYQGVVEGIANVYDEKWEAWTRNKGIMTQTLGGVMPFRRLTGTVDLTTVQVALELYESKEGLKFEARQTMTRAMKLASYLNGLIVHCHFDHNDTTMRGRPTRANEGGAHTDVRPVDPFTLVPVIDGATGEKKSWQKAFQEYFRPTYIDPRTREKKERDVLEKKKWAPRDVDGDPFLSFLRDKFSLDFAEYVLALYHDQRELGQPAYPKCIMFRPDPQKCNGAEHVQQLRGKWKQMALTASDVWGAGPHVVGSTPEILKYGSAVTFDDYKEAGRDGTPGTSGRKGNALIDEIEILLTQAGKLQKGEGKGKVQRI